MNAATTQFQHATSPEGTTGIAPVSVGIHSNSEQRWLIPIFTFVVWTGCAAIGGLGFILHYARPHRPQPQSVMQAEILNVELGDNSIQPEPLNEKPSTPPSSDAMVQPPDVQPIPVAQYTPAIAFALPVEGPTRIVNAQNAAHSIPSDKIAAPSPSPERLTYGQGVGKQPAPEYPARARREGQEGTVGVRFTVDDRGRVTSAELSSPSPWPLLNEATLRVVRERWGGFPANGAHLYEISIRFQLRK